MILVLLNFENFWFHIKERRMENTKRKSLPALVMI